jgi:hypothetical protein
MKVTERHVHFRCPKGDKNWMLISWAQVLIQVINYSTSPLLDEHLKQGRYRKGESWQGICKKKSN